LITVNNQIFTDTFTKRGVKVDWDTVWEIVREIYADKIDRPVYITSSLAYKSFAGVHSCKSYLNVLYKRVWPRGITQNMLDEAKEKGGWFHNIKMSSTALLYAVQVESDPIAKARDKDVWDVKSHYTGHALKNYRIPVYIFHLIAHELQHAIQTDKVDWKTLKQCRGSFAKSKAYDINHNINVRQFKDKYYHTPIEADAEAGAREWGPLMVEMYIEKKMEAK